MLNQTVIVGRIVNDPDIKELKSGKKVSNITLAVPRIYKDENGEYATDFINCTLWNGIASSTSNYCHKGDLIAIKGMLQSKTTENKQGEKIYLMELVAEKVTFLSNQKTKEKDEVDEKEYEENIKI